MPAAQTPLLARAIEQVALHVAAAGSPSVTLELGRSLAVRLAQSRGGVEVTLEAARGLSPLAEGELPHLVAALRARGIRVARAVVSGRGTAGLPSLTPSRGSATRHGDDGTVAKW